MAGAGPHNREEPPEPHVTDRLDSWKEIAAYLKRDERTVRRWEEHEGLCFLLPGCLGLSRSAAERSGNEALGACLSRALHPSCLPQNGPKIRSITVRLSLSGSPPPHRPPAI